MGVTTNATQDLARVLDDMRGQRERLLAAIAPLTPGDLRAQRPGGWSVGRVLQHLIDSEAIYAKLLAHQCGKTAPECDTGEPADGAAAVAALDCTRAAVHQMADGIDAGTLYRLVRFGHDEYSPLSVLENVAAHDHEHIGQIAELLRHARTAVTPATAPKGLTIRHAVEADLPRLTEIYNHYVINTAITFDIEPFTVEQRRDWFSHYAETGRHRLLVAEVDGQVVGYTSSSRYHPRAAYDTTVETTILCAPEWVGRGIGRPLYAALFDALRDEDIHGIVALVVLPNKGSCAIHEHFGFERAGLIREAGRKFGQYWDVATYQKLLP